MKEKENAVVDHAVLGIDFGTSTSVMCLQNFDKDGNRVGSTLCEEIAGEIPTLILEEEGDFYFGREAEARSKCGRGCLHRNFKLGLASTDPQARLNAEKKVRQFFGFLYKTFYEKYALAIEHGLKISTILSVPVKWSSREKEFMRKVTCEAGFTFGADESSVKVVNEATAATYAVMLPRIRQLQESGVLSVEKVTTVMLVDMGAGTSDIAVFQMNFLDGTPHVVENSVHVFPPPRYPHACGGCEVDDLLTAYYCQTVGSRKCKEVVSARMKAWKENALSPWIIDHEDPNDDDPFVCGGGEMALSREQFLWVTKPHWESLDGLVKGALCEAGVASDQIDLVLLTGGHSNWRPFLDDYFVGKGFCGIVPPNFARLKQHPKLRVLADAAFSRSQTVARGLVLSNGALGFHNVAECDYWLAPTVGGKAREKVFLCRKGDVLPLKRTEKNVYAISAGLFRMDDIPAKLSVCRGKVGEWSEVIWETSVSVPVTEKLVRALLGPVAVAVAILADVAIAVKNFLTDESRDRLCLDELAEQSYSMKVEYQVELNDVGSASGKFVVRDADGDYVTSRSFP